MLANLHIARQGQIAPTLGNSDVRRTRFNPGPAAYTRAPSTVTPFQGIGRVVIPEVFQNRPQPAVVAPQRFTRIGPVVIPPVFQQSQAIAPQPVPARPADVFQGFAHRPAPALPQAPVLGMRSPWDNATDLAALENGYRAVGANDDTTVHFPFLGGTASIYRTSYGEFFIRGRLTSGGGNGPAEPDTINFSSNRFHSRRGDGNGRLSPQEETALINAAKTCLAQGNVSLQPAIGSFI
ncbi:MAG: hypothetical protein EOP70_00465 [Variovorax sp.]|jgi:hypothetical protein|nr:MAG: hypothetical protein EOP70_00465 [Variovorax sp.]